MRSYAVLLSALVAQASIRKAVKQAPEDVDAYNAEHAAHVAVQAAKVSNQVAAHATDMHYHAQEALKHAHGALKTAQTDTEGLTMEQKESLEKADSELEAATKKLESEELAQNDWVQDTLADAAAQEQSHATTEHLRADFEDLQVKVGAATDETTKHHLEVEMQAMKHDLDAQIAAEERKQGYLESIGKLKDEVAKMQQHIDTMKDIKQLRAKIKGVNITVPAPVVPGAPDAPVQETTTMKFETQQTDMDLPAMKTLQDVHEEEALAKELQELRDLLKSLEDQHAAGQVVSEDAEKTMRDEVARLRTEIAKAIQRQEEMMQAAQANSGDFTPVSTESATHASDFTPLDGEKAYAADGARTAKMMTPMTAGSGLEVDTEMPYGELEPFGREDTAAELTAASIQESDRMVDQIERAEVAEEKRAVFRALTRLRGAAITSYDGIARSQTGNIDEYNHVHKWRQTHPLHHLADEESDVSKWAFPDNAD